MSDIPARLAEVLADRYALERPLGQGGMATVYLARDLKHDRQVAVKVLRPELGAVLGADRFLSEIRISAGLDHPNILTLIDSGVAEGLLYYVLPYVRGGTLRDRLVRETQLGIEEAVGIARQVASALEYAHRRGVVHRDIKPENIMFQEGAAMLADFGIALAVNEAGGNRLTETGLSLGTPQYMSPEQATGDRALDARSDVYSLGAVLYEMLTGEPPVTGATAQAMIAKLMTERPTSIRTVRATVPVALETEVNRALAKIPADRHADAGIFSVALERALAPDGAGGARVPWKWVAAAAVAVVAGLFAFSRLGTGGGGSADAPAPSAFGEGRQVTFDGNIGETAMSPDGRTAAVLDPSRTMVTATDLDGGGSSVLFRTPVGAQIDAMHWDAPGTRLYIAGAPYSQIVWSVPRLGGTARVELELPNLAPLNGVWVLRLPEGEWLVVGSAGTFYRGPDPAALRPSGNWLTGPGTGRIPGISRLLVGPYLHLDPQGEWLAFAAGDSTGRPVAGLVRVRPGTDAGVHLWPASEGDPVGWSTDGERLFLRRDDGSRALTLLEARVNRTTGALTAHRELALRLPAVDAAVTRDGNRIVAIGGASSSNIMEITRDDTPALDDNPTAMRTTGTAYWYLAGYLPGDELAAVMALDDRYEVFRLGADGSRESLVGRTGGPARRGFVVSRDGSQVAGRAGDRLDVLVIHNLRGQGTREIRLPTRSSYWDWSPDGTKLAGFTEGIADSMMIVDVATGATRMLGLQCGDSCAFATEGIQMGPEWPWAAVTSEVDTWIVNLETGALRHLASNTWTVVGWREPWVYFYRTAGQTDHPTPVLFRVPAAGGAEERVLELPAACGTQPDIALSRDGTRVSCSALAAQTDIWVHDRQVEAP